MKRNRKLKKPQTTIAKFDLEEIIGLTVTNGNGLAASVTNSTFVYIAGCVVVLYDIDSGTQSHLLVSNRSPKPLSCVACSQDGKYIAAGESGHQPAIVVWSSATLASISELKGHQYGVTCTAFSPDGKHLVSVGTPKDGNLCLWDWRSGILVKKLKACSSFSDVNSVSFSADAKLILTSGKRHLKIWAIGLPGTSRAKREGVLLMHGKTINLGNLKGCTFVDITPPIKINGNVADEKCSEPVIVYALTDSGVLCLLDDGLKITQTVSLKVEKGFALCASQDFIACACNNGFVKLYAVGSLEYAGGLPYSEDTQNKKTNDILEYPDAIACQFSTLGKLVVVYRDHSLHIWNINGKFQATKCCVLVSHSACIWDIKNLSCENMHDPSLACIARGCNGGVYFATCSADGTIRLWGLALLSVSTEIRSFATNQDHVITEPLGALCLVGGGTFERELAVSGVITKAYRCMAVSPDGNHLAAGDFDGNLHIFNLETSGYTCIQAAHAEEILCLNFSLPVEKRIDSVDLESYYFLASGGRDKMIHLFAVNRNFDLVASVDDHSAAVSSVKLTGNGRKIVSCGSDRSLIFHNVAGSDKNYNITHSHQQKTSHGTMCDIAIDSSTETAVTVGEDKKINVLDISAGQIIRSFKQGGDFGDPVKVCLDPSCTYVVCSYSDRSICMYDFTSGEMVARAMGHGEAITGIIILPDCRHLVSAGNDGCIFVWKVPEVLTLRMLHRIKENSGPLSTNTISQSQCTALDRIKFYEENYLRSRGTTVFCEGKCPQETPTFRFSVSRLPHWAKSNVTSPFVIPTVPISSKVVGTEDHSPSKSSGGDAPVKLVFHTPSKHNQRSTSSSHSNYSKDSPTQETGRSFALDRRWFTIHNVCLDLLNSPEVYNMQEQMVSLSNSIRGPALGETEIELMNQSSMNPHGTKISVNNASASREEFGHDSSGQTQLSTSVHQVANKCIFNSGKNLASSKGTTCSKQITSQSNSSSSSSKSTEVKTTKMKDHQQECDIIINDKNNTFNACKEALRTLDNASKTTLQVFSKLNDIKPTNANPEESEAQFYAEVTQMLPSIAKNVHEIAKFASSWGVDKVDIPGFEPLLGKFAESLSQRVIELLKENCTSL